MKVISHKKDLKYYNKEAHNSDDEKELVENFIKYVVDKKSFSKKHGIDKKKLQETLKYIVNIEAGSNMLKVITAKYMRRYNTISDFLLENKWIKKNMPS